MQKRAFRGFLIVFLLILALSAVGCGGKKRSRAATEADPAAVRLSQAASQVHAEMMTTAIIMRGGGIKPLQTLLPEDYVLVRPLELNWVGPSWPAVESIARSMEFEAVFTGRRPLADPVVVMKALNDDGSVRRIYDHLSDINFQIANSGGYLTVDSINRRLVLGFASPK